MVVFAAFLGTIALALAAADTHQHPHAHQHQPQHHQHQQQQHQQHPQPQRVIVERASNRHGWVPSARADPAAVSKILVGVHVRDPQALEDTFYEVSDPSHPRYGQHLTFDQIGELIKNEEAMNAVVSWLMDAGLTDITPTVHGELVAASGPIHVLERLLDTRFYKYTHSHLDVDPRIGAEHYSMPIALTRHAYGVLGVLPEPLMPQSLDNQLRPVDVIPEPVDVIPKRSASNVQALSKSWTDCPSHRNCSGCLCPAVLQSRYNIPTQPSIDTNVTIGVFESLNQKWSVSDTHDFFTAVLGVHAPPSYPVHCWDSGSKTWASNSYDADNCEWDSDPCPSDDGCDEANLGMQYILGLTNAKMTVHYSHQTDSDDTVLNTNDFYEWIETVASETPTSSVYSISYFYPDETQVSVGARNAFNTQAKKLGAQGVSIVVPSGDWGADGDSYTCQYTSGWPASSLFVTTVGATQGVELGTTEVACNTITMRSGGGFSSLYTRAKHQSNIVDTYLKNYSSNVVPGYNARGRGFPDVAMAGLRYAVVVGGEVFDLSGTSASATVFATMIALINSELASKGKRPLGFLNPFLYSSASSILSTDITSGDNKGSCKTGFDAVPGWDPVTGLGSIDYAKLLSAAMNYVTPAPSATHPPTSLHTSSPAPSPHPPTSLPTSSPSPSPHPPTSLPANSPAPSATHPPTSLPTSSPAPSPTHPSTSLPTKSPAPSPTHPPTSLPTNSPAPSPTRPRTSIPTKSPAPSPTRPPTSIPTKSPAPSPTHPPTSSPQKRTIRRAKAAIGQAKETMHQAVETIVNPMDTILHAKEALNQTLSQAVMNE